MAHCHCTAIRSGHAIAGKSSCNNLRVPLRVPLSRKLPTGRILAELVTERVVQKVVAGYSLPEEIGSFQCLIQ